MSSETEQRRLGIRQFLSAVNLSDFAQMVGSEARMIARSTGVAVGALRRLPFGPLAFLGGMVMVVLRAVLLVLVVVVFGTAIAVISLVRGLSNVARGGEGPRS
jgi:hypothetical protein